MTYLVPHELQAIKVVLGDQGQPLKVSWQGKAHEVEALTNRYRVDAAWWSDDAIRRDYFCLTTKTGWYMVVYCDLITGDWMLERLYD
jgi:hypothetical protein